MDSKRLSGKRRYGHSDDDVLVGFWADKQLHQTMKGIASALHTDISGLMREGWAALLRLSRYDISFKDVNDMRDIIQHYGFPEILREIKAYFTLKRNAMPNDSITTEIADMFDELEEPLHYPTPQSRRTQRGKHQNWLTQEILDSARQRAGLTSHTEYTETTE